MKTLHVLTYQICLTDDQLTALLHTEGFSMSTKTSIEWTEQTWDSKPEIFQPSYAY